MREILFRGKLTHGREWAYGNLKVSPKDVAIITPDETVIGKYGQVDPETVGQYTGLKDKNGVKIFESDIVKNDEGIGIIKFGEFYEGYGFYIKWVTQNYCREDLPYWVTYDEEDVVTVVGNIYDNPDLLD